ncbi:MAG: hypothetical protein NTV01_07045 [Bacteroidia bacterium]|nr:hypothetical protein [Bacteroidia bacterium]
MPRKTREFTFKDETFTLEEISIWKTHPAHVLIDVIDEYLYQHLELPEIHGASGILLTLLYDFRSKLESIDEILNNLDVELREMGVYKKPEMEQEAVAG